LPACVYMYIIYGIHTRLGDNILSTLSAAVAQGCIVLMIYAYYTARRTCNCSHYLLWGTHVSLLAMYVPSTQM